MSGLGAEGLGWEITHRKHWISLPRYSQTRTSLRVAWEAFQDIVTENYSPEWIELGMSLGICIFKKCFRDSDSC